MEILAHWSFNEPSGKPLKVWDNSGKGKHGTITGWKDGMFNVTNDVPCCMYDGTSTEGIDLPAVSGVRSIAYWLKPDSLSWKLVIVTDGKRYEDGKETRSMAVDEAIMEVKNLLALGSTQVFSISQLYYYSDDLSETDRYNLQHVKARIASDGKMYAKNVRESESETGKKTKVTSAGTVECFEVTGSALIGTASFRENCVLVNDIIEY